MSHDRSAPQTGPYRHSFAATLSLALACWGRWHRLRAFSEPVTEGDPTEEQARAGGWFVTGLLPSTIDRVAGRTPPRIVRLRRRFFPPPCALNERVEHSGNQADRPELRLLALKGRGGQMVRLREKLSGCFCIEAAAQVSMKCRSYIATARKQGHAFLTAIEATLRGTLIMPVAMP